MKNFTRNILAVLVVTFIASHTSFAAPIPCPAAFPHCSAVPEIDAAMGTGALALLGGAVMVIRGRVRAKK
jgi:uncharacterized protein (TIGR03382 family)